jgi:PIN domain nuclease of toxin-antitoxin system
MEAACGISVDRPLSTVGVSPVSFLEIQFLAEMGKLSVRNPDFMNTVMDDARFTVDEIPPVALIRQALRLDWTHDPFDGLLAAHSSARRVALCTVDPRIHAYHALLPAELKTERSCRASRGET